jgi:flap endonuclease-1
MGVKNWKDVVRWKKGGLDELPIPAVAFDMPNWINRRLSVVKRHQKNFERVPLTHATLTVTTIRLAMERNILPVLVFDGPPEMLKRSPNPEFIRKAHRIYDYFKERGNAYDRELAEQLYDSPALRSYFAAYHLKDLCQAIGIPAITAPSEAEMTAAALCRDGRVGSVISNDADVLLFGSPHVCRRLSLSRKEIEYARLSDVLEDLELTEDQLRDLAIMCGCDFHKKGLKGIGPRKGAKLLRRHGTLEGALKASGLFTSEREEYLVAREVFDEAHYINSDSFSLILNSPIVPRLKRMLTAVRGREWAEKMTDELVKLRKKFGQEQTTLEAWC